MSEMDVSPLTLLQLIGDGEVWQEADGRVVVTDREYFGLSDPIGEVTHKAEILRDSGRAEPDGICWKLTTSGREVLAHETTRKAR